MPPAASGRSDRAPDVSALAAAVAGPQPPEGAHGPAAPHVRLFMSPRPVGAPAAPCTRTWTSTGVTATAAVYTRRDRRPLHGRYMAVTHQYTPAPTTGVYWSRRRYSACHLTRVCTDRRAETAHGRAGRHRLPVGCCSYMTDELPGRVLSLPAGQYTPESGDRPSTDGGSSTRPWSVPVCTGV